METKTPIAKEAVATTLDISGKRKTVKMESLIQQQLRQLYLKLEQIALDNNLTPNEYGIEIYTEFDQIFWTFTIKGKFTKLEIEESEVSIEI
jgi:hypothetical protein